MFFLVFASVGSMVNSTEVPGTQTLWKNAPAPRMSLASNKANSAPQFPWNLTQLSASALAAQSRNCRTDNHYVRA
jgi:hypothetical protein